MPEATLTFSDPEQIRILFGVQDKFIRKVYKNLGLDVVVRGDAIQLHGDKGSVRKGIKVLTELRGIIEETGILEEYQVSDVLGAHNHAASASSSDLIELQSGSRKLMPQTDGQVGYLRAIRQNDAVFCAGPAGSGKTYLAVAAALDALQKEQVRKIVLVRPAVEAGEKLGFLPGDLQAKVNPYLRPLLDAMQEMIDYEQVQRYMDGDVIEILPLAFMRGRTLNETFIILDEGQNTTVTQMKMFLTRMGVGSKIVVTGDVTQMDLPSDVPSGLLDAMNRLGEIHGIATVHLETVDIVRHPLVRKIVTAYEEDAE